MRSFSNTALLAAFAASVSACAGEVDESAEDRAAAAAPRYSKDTKILIVGAGPSGLTAALTLGDLGYKNVQIFERESTVGGKVQSLVLPAPLSLSVELGAVFVSDDYTLIRDELAIGRYGYTMEGQDPANADGTWDIREYTTPRYVWQGGPEATGGAPYDFEAFLEVVEPNAAKREAAKTAYAAFLTQYEPYFGDDVVNDNQGLGNLPAEMGKSVTGFCAAYAAAHGGADLTPIFEVARSIEVGFGYGFYETAPAASFIKLLPWIVKLEPDASKPSGFRLDNPAYFVFNDGFQALWKKVADEVYAQQGGNFFYNPIKKFKEVSKVEVCKDSLLLFPKCNGKKYRVWTNVYTPVDYLVEIIPGTGPWNGVSVPNPISETFDKVVFSTSPQVTSKILAEGSDALLKSTRALLLKAKSIQYFLTIFSSSSLTAGQTLFVHDTSFASSANHVHVLGSRSADQTLFLTYQVGDNTKSYGEVHNIMKNDLQTIWGGKMDIGVWKPWPVYFPHVSPADFGVFTTLEANQGVNGLYYTGGFMNMETTEHAARHAKSLVLKKFGAAL